MEEALPENVRVRSRRVEFSLNACVRGGCGTVRRCFSKLRLEELLHVQAEAPADGSSDDSHGDRNNFIAKLLDIESNVMFGHDFPNHKEFLNYNDQLLCTKSTTDEADAHYRNREEAPDADFCPGRINLADHSEFVARDTPLSPRNFIYPADTTLRRVTGAL